MNHLDRFVDAQDANGSYLGALDELRSGRKRTHWMWWVFPQLAGLGSSSTSRAFAIGSLEEARAYLRHPVLGPRLRAATEAVLAHGAVGAREIFGDLDARKFHSSMTLFHLADPATAWCGAALEAFFAGQHDPATDALVRGEALKPSRVAADDPEGAVGPARVPARFEDRAEAGRRLGRALESLRGADAVVLGLPRGGVAVAVEVAAHLGLPLDVIIVRKVGAPHQPELAMGAVGEDGALVVNERVARMLGRSRADVEEAARSESGELAARAARFREVRPRESLEGRTAVVVDDGVATGATARAACEVARHHGARRVVLAVPVGPPGAHRALRDAADEVVVLDEAPGFAAVGERYVHFEPVGDDEVVAMLVRPLSGP